MTSKADDKFCITRNVNGKIKLLALIDVSAMPTKCNNFVCLFFSKVVGVELRAFTFVS